MATKKELEDEINEKLETDIEWAELQKEDLETFKELTEDEEFIKLVVANYAGDKTGGLTKSAVSNWAPGKGVAVLMNDDADITELLF